jgi:hypothetical protein
MLSYTGTAAMLGGSLLSIAIGVKAAPVKNR